MKENSIREDIKWIEKIIKKCDDCGLHECIACEICWTEVQAIKHVLKDYKKLQEEFKQVDHECERLEEKEVRLIKENEELKNNTRKNENELEFDIDCDWIALQKILDESERSNEYISYKNEKWIKEKYCVPIQKIKDKIETFENLQKAFPNNEEIRIRIIAYKELLEREE